MLGLQVIQVWSKLQWALYHSAHWNVTWLQGRISKDIVWNQGWNSFPNPRWENDFVSAAREDFDLECDQVLPGLYQQEWAEQCGDTVDDEGDLPQGQQHRDGRSWEVTWREGRLVLFEHLKSPILEWT